MSVVRLCTGKKIILSFLSLKMSLIILGFVICLILAPKYLRLDYAFLCSKFIMWDKQRRLQPSLFIDATWTSVRMS